MKASAAGMVAAIRQHQLLEPGPIDELAGTLLAHLPEPRALARELIERRWLTPFQISQIVRGRGGRLCFGPYILLERLGKGGMGRVFKVRRRDDGQILALKILRARFVAHPLALQRFGREAKAFAQLAHPNIVTAYGAGEVAGTPYLAMEYVEGIDLFRYVEQRGRLPIPEACAIARQAALGLQHAHEHGVIHRDIKPRNLLIARTGGAPGAILKIVDFGLALLESETAPASRLTQLGRRVGTAEYMAPEQEVNVRAADVRSDVYSLGCSLYFALVGRPPFLEAEREGLATYPPLAFEAPPVQCFRPEVPTGLSAVLAKMLIRAPDRRYQSAAEVAAALQPFCPELSDRAQTSQASGTRSRRGGAAARVRSSPSRRAAASRRGLLLGGVCAMALLGLVLVLVLQPFEYRGPHGSDDAGKRDGRTGKPRVRPDSSTPRDGRPTKKKEEIEDPPAPAADEGKPTKKKEEIED